MDAVTLKERYALGGMFLLGRGGFQNLLDEHFGGQVPEPGTGMWIGFVFAVNEAPHNTWLRTWFKQLPADKLPDLNMPTFPKELENVDHFHAYNAREIPLTEEEKCKAEAEGRKKKTKWRAGFRPTSVEPFWVGFWASSDIRNPYKCADNADAFDNGRALSKTKHAETYRQYVGKCRQVCRKAWGEGVLIP